MARDTGKLRLTAVSWFPSDDQARVHLEFNTRKNGPVATRWVVPIVLEEDIRLEEVATKLRSAVEKLEDISQKERRALGRVICDGCGADITHHRPGDICGGCYR